MLLGGQGKTGYLPVSLSPRLATGEPTSLVV
jgi:hypothetical protein